MRIADMDPARAAFIREKSLDHATAAVEQADWLGNKKEAAKLRKVLAALEAQSAAPPTGE